MVNLRQQSVEKQWTGGFFGSAKGIKAKKPVKNTMHWWLYIPTVVIGGCQMDAQKKNSL
jgi:hypothetical protein